MDRHARRREIPFTEVEEGVVLYDADLGTAHSLSPVAGAVWRACDGRTPRQIAAALGEDVAVVEAQLEELRAAHLLEPDGAAPRTVSRRQALKRLGGVALAPAVISIALPAAARAQSGCQSDGSPCTFDSDCCQQICIGENAGGPGVCRDAGCGQNADPCNNNDECCTANPFCDFDQCAPCISNGAQPCGSDSQCCSGICENGSCTDCRTNGEACNGDAECCSSLCRNGACVACLPKDEACGSDAQCCSVVCFEGNCT